MIEFFIPIEPMATPRPRFAMINGHAVAYPTAAYKMYQAELATFFATLKLEDPIEVHKGPVELRAQFTMPRPKGKAIIERGWMKPDLDNMIKGVMDAMTKAAYFWHDDAQVVDLHISKRFANGDDPLGVRVQLTNW